MSHVIYIAATERELIALTSAGQIWRRNHATGQWAAIALPPDCQAEPIFDNADSQMASVAAMNKRSHRP
jgi:hypothetical protein